MDDSALRKLAEKATPRSQLSYHNFQKACSPERILALLDRVAAAEANMELMRGLPPKPTEWVALTERLDRAEAGAGAMRAALRAAHEALSAIGRQTAHRMVHDAIPPIDIALASTASAASEFVEKLKREEREACARFAEEITTFLPKEMGVLETAMRGVATSAGKRIAAAIRARGDAKE